ncbi:integral membrane protein 2B isoform X2 [Xiphophorus maculatus]|uniref:Integral membrane protein 2 n=1 Tax=Xiphophorus maculatus TaxID=8083 RepID=M4A2N9_XIPMA|nr:integral membrane protein 2B isoform X2 [Xiphophorus maculatus]
MVKVSFNTALAQKDVKKDAETLIPEDETDAEAAVLVRRQSRTWCWCMCLGLALMLSGVVVAGAYLYHYYNLEPEDQVFFCGVKYEEDYMVPDEEVDMPNRNFERLLEEKIRVLERDQVEFINVPVPDFEDGDAADIVHDFQRRLTAYLDLHLNKCYVIPLNTSIVMPPRDLLDLLMNIKSGSYLPQSYLIHEEMMVTERLENVDQLGFFIYNLCHDKETFKLQRRNTILGMQKREALNCRKIRHFENKFVVETLICEP